MPWIEFVEEAQAEGLLKEVYERQRNLSTGRVSLVLKVQSLNPEALNFMSRMSRAILYGHSGLSRVQREMIATAVSSLNQCSF